ncbi:hypothetical protein KBD49_08365 [Myxococcota bacterium]|nr:hypothetical protein [Myxococcota bacterium]
MTTARDLRKRVLVNYSFQLRYSVVLAGIVLVIFVLLGALYREALREQKALLGLSAISQTAVLTDEDRDFDQDLSSRVDEEDQRRVASLAIGAAILVAMLAWLGIRLSFRAAGPAIAVSRMLRSMAEGDFQGLRRFRHGDDFRFLEEDVFALRDACRRDALEEVEMLDRVLAFLERSPGEGTAALAEAIRQRRDAIRGRFSL